MSIYDELRAFAAMDLTRNEMKVWLVYRAEMDEGCRQVRNKSGEQLRALTGLGQTQFRVASGSLQRRGLIDARRQRNAPQVITVPVPETTVEDVRKVRTSGNSEVPNSGHSGFPNSGHSGNPNRDIYTAPVTAPESAPSQRAMREDDMPAHIKPISNWNLAFAQPEPGIEIDGGRIRLVNGTRAEWLEKFGGDAEALDLALIEVSGQFQPNSRSHTPKQQIERALAGIVRKRREQDNRYRSAVEANAKARSQSSAPSDKPTVGELLRRKREQESVAA